MVYFKRAEFWHRTGYVHITNSKQRSTCFSLFLIGFQPRPASSGRPVIRQKKKIAYRWIDFLLSTTGYWQTYS